MWCVRPQEVTPCPSDLDQSAVDKFSGSKEMLVETYVSVTSRAAQALGQLNTVNISSCFTARG